MRRSYFALGGVVCALLACGGVLAVWHSSKDEAKRTESSSSRLAEAKKKEAPPVAMRLVAAPEAKKASKTAMDSPGAPAEGTMARKEAASAMDKLFAGAGAAPASAGMGGLGLQGSGSGATLGGIGAAGRGAGSGALLGAPYNKSSNKGASVHDMLGGKPANRSPRSMAASGAPADPLAHAEDYRDWGINPFVSTSEDRLSTFSIDVDTASYTIARRKLLEGTLPPQQAVRVEEFLNYFRYAYAEPSGDAPLAVHMDAAPSPFTPGRHLLRVGVQGKHLSISERKPAHLTFLVDVSGSMQSPDKLPLAKRALRLLVDNLRDGDTVALVTYAGGVKLALPPTGLEHKAQIHAAIEELTAGGSTAMASGIELAYQQAMKKLNGQSVSRVIILSDGDANVGPTGHEAILKLIRGYVKEGITVTTVGFGMGNYKDTLMEQFANQGNGNHYYVDSLMQARRIFQEQLGGTLEVIAQDVKLQVEFDPTQVVRYRLVGYENRTIADIHFRDDKVDAGELGAGHTVTALYELELKRGAGAGLATVRVRAKKPRGEKATEREYRFPAGALAASFSAAAPDLRFSTSVMGAAELFRRSPHAQRWSFAQVLKIARGATSEGNTEREEFIALLEKARPLVERVAAR